MVTLALLSALYPFAAFGVTPLGSKTATRFSVFVRLRDRMGGREDGTMGGSCDIRLDWCSLFVVGKSRRMVCIADKVDSVR